MSLPAPQQQQATAPAPQLSPATQPAPAAPPTVTVVTTADELREAAASGANHIEIQAHLDLRDLPRAQNPLIGNGVNELALLYASGDLQSVRGRCKNHASALPLGRSATIAGSPELVPLLPGQCLLLITETWLMVNKGTIWIDNIYLKAAAPRLRTEFAFITAGARGNRFNWPQVVPSDIYVTDVTFQAGPRAEAVGVTADHPHTSVYLDGCVFTDWAPDFPPLAIKHESLATIRNTIFRNMRRFRELVDVSFGGTVSFTNATLGNVTLSGQSIAGTTASDYSQILEPHSGHLVTYYAADDYSGVLDVTIEVKRNPSGPFRSEYWIADRMLSDCLYQRTGENVTMPGCPPESTEQRVLVREMNPRPPGGGRIPGFEFYDPWALLDERLLLPNTSWFVDIQRALPKTAAPPGWPPAELDPSGRGPRNDLFSRSADSTLQPIPFITRSVSGEPPPWGPGSGPPRAVRRSPGAAAKNLQQAMVRVCVAVVLLMVAASAAAWLWLRCTGRTQRDCFGRRNALREKSASGRAGGPEDMGGQGYQRQNQFGSHTRTVKGKATGRANCKSHCSAIAAEPQDLTKLEPSKAMQPQSCLNPDYEYALPSHLALFAQPFTTDGTATSTQGEPGSTIVLPPYTVSTAPGFTSTDTDPASSQLDNSCGRHRCLSLHVPEILQAATASEGADHEAAEAIQLSEVQLTPEHAHQHSLHAEEEQHEAAASADVARQAAPHLPQPPMAMLSQRPAQGKALFEKTPATMQQSARVAGPKAQQLQLPVGRSISLKLHDDRDLGHEARRLERKLDSFKQSDLFLGQLEMLGRRHRRRGGQSVVQFALGSFDSCQYAIKFFLDRAAFLTEAALYAAAFPHIRDMVSSDVLAAASSPNIDSSGPDNHATSGIAADQIVQEEDDAGSRNQSPVLSSLASRPKVNGNRRSGIDDGCKMSAINMEGMPDAVARLLPQVEAVHCQRGTREDLASQGVVDPRGRPLPPCIVMEKGESLHDWSERAEPDRFAAIAVLANISKRLADLHAAGYVHRDLKPGNVMWLPRQNRWTIIDFGCVARVGERAPLSFTLAYAAPEVATAYREQRPHIEAQAALDAWSLGIMALELLTRAPAFNMLGDGCDGVLDRLAGERPLPWEDPRCWEVGVQRKLGVFKGPVLQLLLRDPSQRASMQEFHASCNKLFTGAE